ncbi:response regulator transcription factor [Pseudomonas caspiana]|uniref:DNA-binding response regulator n=1 Tax=Pseudomonas caspiana TaxID=1451454 RepID=A0A1Y3NWA1_9PSED|nr:response regulator transcription factor [Pseudomonas caspiana]OUM71885.1 hypothetical protein AUC60_21420 [Pseudomonas caspiana]
MATILVADDHSVVRMAVKVLLEKAGHSVIEEISNGIEVVAAIRRRKPDLIILDIDLPNIDGFEVLRRLAKEEDNYKVIVFSAMSAERFSDRCQRLGAVGYVSKVGELSDLITAVQVVVMGYTLFPVIATTSVDKEDSTISEEELIKSLSPRELVVLRHIVRGLRIINISDEMMLSSKTISTYKARLLTKLRVGNVPDLVDLAKRNGIF